MATKSSKSTIKSTKKAAAPKARRKAQEPEVAAAVPPAPPVVGIGASAGGLEAFTQLLGALPTNTGMAFVLIQHLEPKHESVLTVLLSRATTMPVAEITNGMRVEPNHVYVIPANADLTLVDGTLKATVRKSVAGRHAPIDGFLRSLAETQGPRAVGVILSGTASDGTAGVKAIKQEGGTTFAQDPDSAKFDGMPRSAIGTGCVDFVFPPERIGRELARIARHPFAGLMALHDVPPLPAHEDDWARLFRLLRTATGVDFRLYKQSTIKRRVARRMAANKVDTLAAYQTVLERNQAEVEALFGELLILVTDFFRDPEVFDVLRDKIFPRILREKPADDPIRMWSAGCSSGQETYSLAITLLESLGDKASGRTIQIFGSDVSEKAIEQARLGLYSEDEVRGVSKQRLQRFFRRVNGHYQIEDRIREMCVFARHDLTRDPPFSRLDLLSCRNVLIYFDIPLQRKVLSAFHYGLLDNGVLLLGKTESLGVHSELFAIVDRNCKVFRRNLAAQLPFSMAQRAAEQALPGRIPRPETSPAIDLEKEADQKIWERSSIAGLVVNDDLQILHFRGDTSPYLRPAPGKASLQLMRILREEIVLEVRTAIQKARRGGKTVRAEGIEIRNNQHSITVNVEVCPLVPTGTGRSFLILFEPASTKHGAPASGARRARVAKTRETQEVVRLRAELVRTREYVQSVIRDQETANEELKTANEEALSSMEELQSTNEELETAKEELQSSNEELVTLNEQLQNRNSELGVLSNDLGNVLSGVDIPIVLLDANGRIRRFTPPAEKLLGMIGADVGRPFSKLRIGIHIPDMEDLLATVIAKGKEVSREVQTDSGHWFQLRLRPFRGAEAKVQGVLLAFVDIHQVREHQEALQNDRNFISAILNAAKDLLVVVLDREGRIVHFNRVCEQLTGYTADEAKGRMIWDFLLAPEEAASARAAFIELKGASPDQRENHWIAKGGERLLINWSRTEARSERGVESVIVTGINVTQRQQAQVQARQSDATVVAVLESSAQAILACARDGRIVLANPMAHRMFGYSAGALLGQTLDALLPERFRTLYQQRREAWFAEPGNRSGLELAGLCRDGSEFPIEVSLSSFAAEGGKRGVAFISDITERKKSEQAMLEYRDHLAAEVSALARLREAGDRLWRLHDLKAGLEEMVDAGMSVVGADMGNIQLLDPGKKVLEIVAHRGFGPDFLNYFREVSAAEGSACGRTLRNKERTIIEDVQTDAESAPFRAIAAAAGYRAVQSSPLIGNNDEVIGVFSTHFRQPLRPAELDLRRFDLYTRQTAEFVERVRAEEQLRRSEGAVQALLETAAQAVLAIDKEGRIVLANATAGTMFGYSREELLAGKLEKLIPKRLGARHAKHRIGWFADPHARPMGANLDLAGLRKDGSEFPIEVSLSHIGADGGILGVAFVSDITERKKNEQTLVDYKDQLQKLSGALISARETGNREIARELHDVFSQELAALGMDVSSLKHGAGSEGDLSARLSELGKRIQRLADSIHETSRKLHPAILEDLGLRVALKQECESFEQRSEIPTQFVATDVVERLPFELSLTLYRVAQECLRNIQKHAPASDSVQVTLIGSPEEVKLRVVDSGDGFDLDEAMRKGGLGLISMEERVRTVNGKITVESEPGKGTTVTAFVPLETKPE